MRNRKLAAGPRVLLLFGVVLLGGCAGNGSDTPDTMGTSGASSSSTGGIDLTPATEEDAPTTRVGGITYGQWDEDLDDFRIWIANADGSDPEPLADVASWMSDWSPDGRRIVYEDELTLQIVNADLTGRRELQSSLGVQWAPEWSPTGEWIAFEGSPTPVTEDIVGQFDRRTVWVIAPDGDGLREVLPGVFGVEPVFSPDGQHIAFGHVTKKGSWTTAEQAVEIVNLDGTGRRQVVSARPGLQHVDWSADNWLVFNIEGVPDGQQGPPDQGTLFAVRPDGSHLHVVRRADEHYNFFKPIWSPDGSQILSGCYDRLFRVDKLCVMDRDGTNLKILVSKAPVPVNFPAWGASP